MNQPPLILSIVLLVVIVIVCAVTTPVATPIHTSVVCGYHPVGVLATDASFVHVMLPPETDVVGPADAVSNSIATKTAPAPPVAQPTPIVTEAHRTAIADDFKQKLIAAGVNIKDSKKEVDGLAAAEILEQFLRSKN